MKQITSEVKQQQLEWRRAQVLELASEGYTQREIANKLQIDLAAVNRDIQSLRQQAQERIQKHIHETVPEEYQKCMTGMKQNLKQTLEIAETVADPKIKLPAHAIVTYIYKHIMDLATNRVIINDALRIIQSKVNMLNGVDNISSLSKSNSDEMIIEDELKGEEDKTTSGVF
jgi:predicted transcriptional regulator